MHFSMGLPYTVYDQFLVKLVEKKVTVYMNFPPHIYRKWARATEAEQMDCQGPKCFLQVILF